MKVIPSPHSGRRCRSADFERLQAWYDVSTGRYSRKDSDMNTAASDYREISRCWYDLAVAKAAVAKKNELLQEGISSRSRLTTGSDQSHEATTGLHSAHRDQVRGLQTSKDVSGCQTGGRITPSDLQLLRDDVVQVVVPSGEVDGGRSTLNEIDVSCRQRRSRSCARQNDERVSTGARQKKQVMFMEAGVPRRCRSASRTRRRALNRELRLTRTTTTTETTTITPQHHHHHHHQHDDESHSHARHRLTTVTTNTKTTVTTNISQVNSHHSNAVAIDNDDSSAVVADDLDLSAGDVSDVTDGLQQQRDDVIVTSESCGDVTPVTSRSCDDLTSVSSDVTTDVAIGDDDATDERDDLRLMLDGTKPPPVIDTTTDHVAVNVASYVVFDEDVLAAKCSEKDEELGQVVEHEEKTDNRGTLEDRSGVVVVDELKEHQDISVISPHHHHHYHHYHQQREILENRSDVVVVTDEYITSAVDDSRAPVTVRKTEEDSKVSADDVGPSVDDLGPGADDVDENKRVASDDVAALYDVDRLTYDSWRTNDSHVTTPQHLLELSLPLETDYVECSDDEFVECVEDVEEAPDLVITETATTCATDDGIMSANVVDASVMEIVDDEHAQVTDQSEGDVDLLFHPDQTRLDDVQLRVPEGPQTKPVCGEVDDVMTVELTENVGDDVVPKPCDNVEVNRRVSSDTVETEPRESDAVIPTKFVTTLSFNCGEIEDIDEEILSPVVDRHVTSLVVLELGQTDETNDLHEVIETRDDTRSELVQRADDMTDHRATAMNAVDDNVMSVDTDPLLPSTDDVATDNTIVTSDVHQYTDHCHEICLHLYDDSHLSLAADFGPSDASGQAEFYVDHWQTTDDEEHDICSVDSNEVGNTTVLFDAVFVRDVSSVVQSQELESDVHSESGSSTMSLTSDDCVAVVKSSSSDVTQQSDMEVKSLTEESWERSVSRAFDENERESSTMSLTSDDCVAVVKSSSSDVTQEVKSLTEESCEQSASPACRENERDKAESDGQIVVHDYGEMWSVFREVPLWVDVLRAEVIDRHNADPRVSRLLLRYPSLRPSTWVWTRPPLVRDLQHAGRPDDVDESRPTAADLQRSVSECSSYAVHPVIERCTLVVTSSHDVIL